MGRAESEDWHSVSVTLRCTTVKRQSSSIDNSLRSIGATDNLVIPPKIAYLYTNKINLREALTKHHNRAEDSGLNRYPILQCSRMAILDTICHLRYQ